MSEKQQPKRNIIFFAGLVFFLTVFILVKIYPPLLQPPEKIQILETNFTEKNISATVIAGDSTFNLSLPAGRSLYDALLLAKENKQITFSGKNYPGLGFLVTGIGPLQSGGGKYLFYYINNQEASVGVSSYLLKDGDVIEWKLK